MLRALHNVGEELTMAYPIQPTPVLYDEDAERLFELMATWEEADYQLPNVKIPKETIADCIRKIKAAKQAPKPSITEP